MKAFLLTYNPDVWQWKTMNSEIDMLKSDGSVDTDWDCYSKKPKEGDLFFITALGTSKQKGIFCSGYVKDLCQNVPSNTIENKITNNLHGNIIALLNPDKEKILSIDILKDKSLYDVIKNTRKSGREIDEKFVDKLLELWKSFLKENHGINYDHIAKEYFEGNFRQNLYSRYERNIEARNACIERYGYTCQVCKINMEEKYGDVGKNFIHVHHIKFLSDIKKQYKIDPINDLVTLCPNCHSMLHRKIDGKYLSVQELKGKIKQP
jgi:5-methylcytosine-specific restriction protein A